MATITPAIAAEQLLLRRAARKSMADYVNYMDLGVSPALHHKLIISKLEAVERGEIPQLALFLPPGSGKSTYASVFFPAYFLGRNPDKSILACSHTQGLAESFGRKVRNLFSRPDHNRLFNVTISRDSQAASHWATELGGEYFAAGVGTAISGRRADIGIIDDPVKGIEDADSTLAQERTWEWYVSDFLPRLKPGSPQILIQTRWNEADLAGKILEREGPSWEVIELAFEALEGDPLGRELGAPLWSDWFYRNSTAREQIAKAKLDVRGWNAKYQQRPVQEEGDYFKLSWFNDFVVVPETVHFYGASDYAATEGGGDFTEHGIFGLDPFENIYIIECWRGQTSTDVWVEKQCDLIQRYEPLAWFGEAGPIRRAIEPYLLRRMDERKAFCRLEWLSSIYDKPVKCKAFQALASRGKVFLPQYASWKADLLHELASFPAGRYDDGVDMCSLLGRGLDVVNAPRLHRWKRIRPEISAPSGSDDASWMTV